MIISTSSRVPTDDWFGRPLIGSPTFLCTSVSLRQEAESVLKYPYLRICCYLCLCVLLCKSIVFLTIVAIIVTIEQERNY